MGLFELGTAFAADTVSDQVAPPFLQGPNGSAFLTAALGQQLDQLRFRSAAAIANRFPLLADQTALYYLGLDRLLTQAVGESSATFAGRLSNYLNTWQIAGTDWVILQQVLAQIAPIEPTLPAAFVVNDYGDWAFYFPGSTPQTKPPLAVQFFTNWDWDSVAKVSYYQIYWRCFIGVHDATTWGPAWATLGDASLPTLGTGTALNGSLGFATIPPTFWTGIANIVATFHRSGAWFEYFLAIYSADIRASFGPDLSTGAGNPDGTYGIGYKIVSGQYESSWPGTVVPVPLAPATRSVNISASNIQNSEFGYKIVNGQYLPA